MIVAGKLVELCAKDDLGEGEVLKVEKDGLAVAVYRVEGEFYVTDDACTHGPGSLSEGYLDGHVIECDFHNGAFDIRSGAVVAPPCMVPVKTYKVIPNDGAVVIEVGEH
jgi:nitrite reductase/ring-hydroxylating ferredoxin subunit